MARSVAVRARLAGGAVELCELLGMESEWKVREGARGCASGKNGARVTPSSSAFFC